ncbi:hypothetical protein BJ508DRAFT_303242 [Ascobolus immersus RN42]|uniref:Peptidase A2 domain-containing protein n=1 Tax=Ascobolus immersus RN42 TaxID=1160509 RepID=A0A3N4IGD9_ASCIM|nr:hypothetical protein BJ508DRAFT_303242 [Ascobolus immersus RN42]
MRRSFLDIPDELHCRVSIHLSASDLSQLSQANRYVHSVYSPTIFRQACVELRHKLRVARAKTEIHSGYLRFCMWTREARGYLRHLNEFLIRFFRRWKFVIDFERMLDIAGSRDFYFLSAIARSMLVTQKSMRCSNEMGLSWEAPFDESFDLTDRLVYLCCVLKRAAKCKPLSATHNATDGLEQSWPLALKRRNCSRSEWKDTFMTMAIHSNSLEAVKAVWCDYHQKNITTLEDGLPFLLHSAIANLWATKETIVPIMNYIMDEWEVSPNYSIGSDLCSREFNQREELLETRPTLMEVLVRPFFHNQCECASIWGEKASDRWLWASPYTNTLYEDSTVPLGLIQLLIRRGASVTGQYNPFQWMMIASRTSDWDMDSRGPLSHIGPPGALKTLLDAGADPTILTVNHSTTLLHLPQNLWHDIDLFTLVASKSTETINFQAVFNSAAQEDERFTPLQVLLMRAVYLKVEGEWVIPFVRTLLDHGADPFLKDGPRGRSAIMIAVADLPRMKRVLEVLVPDQVEREKWMLESYWRENGCLLSKADVLCLLM